MISQKISNVATTRQVILVIAGILIAIICSLNVLHTEPSSDRSDFGSGTSKPSMIKPVVKLTERGVVAIMSWIN